MKRKFTNKITDINVNLLTIAILKDRIEERQRFGMELLLHIDPEGEWRHTKRGHIVWLPTIDDATFDTMHAARRFIAKFATDGIDGVQELFDGAAIALKNAMEEEGFDFPGDVPELDWIFDGTQWEPEPWFRADFWLD